MDVTVSQPSVIKVQVGGKPTTVQSIAYGTRTLKSATDLTIVGGQTGDSIVYDAANNNFRLATATANLDAGFF
jgi:hypothetical protein